ncbi:MAG: hypothetical protein F4Y22_08965 [Gammaproteobacteria bacterium]|nr:hypothetical protein [Gammaproteobacteria bacterium]
MDVKVRLATAVERPLWDALMDERHYLGFHRFAGRGLRYVAVWRGRWLALAGEPHQPHSTVRGPAPVRSRTREDQITA